MVQRLSTEVTSTALVGPNSLFREGLKQVLPAKVVAETIESVQQVVELDLIVFIAGTDQAALCAQVRRAKEENAHTRVVVLSDIDRSEVIWPLLAAGADGYLLREISLEALLASLDLVMLGGTVVLPAPRNAFPSESMDCARLDRGGVEAEIPVLDAEAEYKKLSDREREILLCLTKGESNKKIARNFGITEATVKVHIKAILRKIRVSNRTQAAVWAHRSDAACSRRAPQTAALDFKQDPYRGPIVQEAYERQSIGVQEGVLIDADEPGVPAFS